LIVSFERDGVGPPPAGGAVVSVGVFDGVHLGHQAILAENVAHARSLTALPTVVTFRHHPKQVLLGHAPRTLTSLEHRLELFRRAGIAHTVVLSFDEALRNVPAAEFAREFLADGLGARRFVSASTTSSAAGAKGRRSACASGATTSSWSRRSSSPSAPSRAPRSARRSSSAT
jgi:riboflavin kinase/FMN adenylyltransferase